MSSPTRENFPNDEAWRAWLETQARLLRPRYVAKLPKPDPNSPSMRLWKRMKQREWSARWRASHREQSRQSAREWKRANPDRVKMHKRHFYAKHREQIILMAAWWRRENREAHRAASRRWLQEHRDERRAYVQEHRDHINRRERDWRHANPDRVRAYSDRAYAKHRDRILAAKKAKRKRTNPAYLGQEERLRRALAFEDRVVALRLQGLTFSAIAQELGKSSGACSGAHFRAMKRRQQHDKAA